MRQVVLTRLGAPSTSLQLVESADPPPVSGMVRIRVRAIGVNFADVMIRLGVIPNAPKLPAVVGWEVAGTVETSGHGFEAGDKVFALVDYGGYSDLVHAAPTHVFPLPAGWTFEQGAAFPVSFLLAYQVMIDSGNVKATDRVLLHGAAGAVGQAAVQLGRMRGCTLLGTASARKHDALRAQGVTPIDYRTEDVVEAVARHTGGAGVDLVLDPIGGDSWKKSYAALAPGGRLFISGMHQPVTGGTRSFVRMAKSFFSAPRFSPLDLLDQGKGVLGVNLGRVFKSGPLLGAWMNALLGFAAQGHIDVRVGHTFRLDEAARAHQFLQEGGNVGKVVLVP